MPPWAELLLFAVSSIVLNITSYWTRVGWRMGAGGNADFAFGSQRFVLIQTLESKMVEQTQTNDSQSSSWLRKLLWVTKHQNLVKESECWVVCTLCLWEHQQALLNSISWRALGLFPDTVTKTTRSLSSACSLCLRLDLFCSFSSCQPLHFSLFLVSVSLTMRCEETSLKADLNGQ